MRDKVIVITGASSGIGKALVYEFASRKADIVMAARNIDVLNKIEQELKSSDINVLSVKTDVSVESDCKNLIDKSIERFGKINVLINNAGISMRAAFDDVQMDVLRKLMDTNYWGALYCSKFALPHLLKSKGSLVAVSSIAGFKGLPGRSGYTASKAALQGLMDVIRLENFKKELHVMVACPGFTSSNIRFNALTKDGTIQSESPLKEDKLMGADEVAFKIADGVLNRRRQIIMTFDGIATVFLNKFFPRFLDSLVFNKISKEPGSPVK